MEPKMSAAEFEVRRAIYAQWDKQMLARRSQLAYIKLNNLYLAIERGSEKLNVHTYNELYAQLAVAYPASEDNGIISMTAYWEAEFEKLPNWFNV